MVAHLILDVGTYLNIIDTSLPHEWLLYMCDCRWCKSCDAPA